MNNKFLDNLFKANDELTEQMTYHNFCKQFTDENGHCNGCPFLVSFQASSVCVLNKANSALEKAKEIYQNLK